jgi:pimeloyl-ACP methyl ester carboxylesterase
LTADIVFLPGAGGRKSFWEPVARLLQPNSEPRVIGWPGFGDAPQDGSISCLSDLTNYVMSFIESPVHLVAQSMGGVVAMNLVLEYPAAVKRLVFAGTSGGIDVSRFGGEDWRAEALAERADEIESAPSWFIEDRTELTTRIPSIVQPALLIWGEDDRISPPTAGQYLASLLPNSTFVTTAGGHNHPLTRPQGSAGLISSFLNGAPIAPAGIAPWDIAP